MSRSVFSRMAGHRDDSELWTWVTVFIVVPMLLITVMLMPLWMPFFWLLDYVELRDKK